jgi:hypothetical protein
MYNYASLVAEQHILNLLDINSVNLNIDNLSINEAKAVLTAHSTLPNRNNLLSRNIELIDEEAELKFCYLEQTVNEDITRETWVDGVVSFMYHLKTYSVRISQKECRHNLNFLTLNKMLLDGYKFKEVPGEFYIIQTPSGIRSTQLTHCDCTDYQRLKKCDHVNAITCLVNNRRLTLGLQSSM